MRRPMVNENIGTVINPKPRSRIVADHLTGTRANLLSPGPHLNKTLKPKEHFYGHFTRAALLWYQIQTMRSRGKKIIG